MKRPRLQVMLLAPLLATAILGSLGLGVYVDRAVERDLLATIDADLSRTAAALSNAGPTGEPGQGPPDLTADRPLRGVLAPDGLLLAGSDIELSSFVSEIAALSDTTSLTTLDGDTRYRVASRAQPDGTTVVVALSLGEVDASLASLRRNLLLGGIVLVSLQALIAVWVARLVGRPVARLSKAAHRVSEGDLEADLGPPAGPRETAALTEDLTVMIAQLRDTIARSDESASEAQRARADMEHFMADAAHELRTPLTALRGYSELFEAGMLDDAGLQRAMKRIGGESERLTDLVNDLLNLVRPSDTANWEEVDLAAIVSAVVYDLRAAHPSHPITHDIESHSSFVVSGDPARLHQAVLNLAANACQHTASGTPVELQLARDATAVVVRIVDHGDGIDADAAEGLFAAFARGDESRSRRSHDGAGLGLALVRRIAERHRGTIAVESTPGGGATFCLRIPRGK